MFFAHGCIENNLETSMENCTNSQTYVWKTVTDASQECGELIEHSEVSLLCPKQMFADDAILCKSLFKLPLKAGFRSCLGSKFTHMERTGQGSLKHVLSRNVTDLNVFTCIKNKSWTQTRHLG